MNQRQRSLALCDAGLELRNFRRRNRYGHLVGVVAADRVTIGIDSAGSGRRNCLGALCFTAFARRELRAEDAALLVLILVFVLFLLVVLLGSLLVRTSRQSTGTGGYGRD